MCQIVDDYADKRAKKRVNSYAKLEKIRNVLRLKDFLKIKDICVGLNISEDIVDKILGFNSNDATYIYEQMKDTVFTLQ